MFSRKALAALPLMLMASTATHAGIEEGDKTVSIFGALTFDEFTDSLTVQAAGGLFVTDTLEVQGVALLVSSEDDFGNVSATSGYGMNANLYLPGGDPDFIPYVGGGGTLILTDFNGTTDTAFGLNGQAGIKQFLNESVSVNYQAQFITSSDYDATIFSVGFTIFLD